jgi:spermidine synthase
MINEAACSLATLEQRGFPYVELDKKILFVDMGLQQKDILVLGAGGFSISAAGTQGNRFTYVDIDKDVHRVVKKYFLDKINGQFVAEDARAYLNAHANSYDVIFSDVYSNKRTIPAHLLTREYFMSVRKSLRPNALAVFNVIARPTMDDNYSMRVDNTIRSVFNQCMVVPIKYIEGPQNIMYFCRNNNNIMKNDLYTDNQNQATLDFLNAN